MTTLKTKLASLNTCLSIGMATGLAIGSCQVIAQDQSIEAARTSFKAQSGLMNFVAAPKGKSLVESAGSADDAALKAISAYGNQFGIADPARDLQLTKQNASKDGRSSFRYQQTYQGIPVIGGELIVNVAANNAVLSINGEASPIKGLTTQPTLESLQAIQAAQEAIAKWHSLGVNELSATVPTLSVYVPELIGPGTGPAALVWQLEVAGGSFSRVREYVLVDANTGGIRLHFNQIHDALNLETYTANGTSIQPGTLLCDETTPDCTGGTNVDADLAHTYATDTYNFFSDEHGRDGIDNAGGVIISTVEWFGGMGSCPNAFWDGVQVTYCAGAAQADDVVAHEITHGITENTSNLFYYYQSGAINESLSDVWGEFIDLTNTGGTDDAPSRWLVGEDFVGLGAIRDMSDPTVFGDPDRVTSPFYFTGPGDNGGVHINSGINNKAAYLMVDGDTFNGITVTGIGLQKTADIYYEVQTNFLTSGSDYGDLYEALFQACTNLIGQEGITAGDCDQVRLATDAVEMNLQPVADFNPDAPYCPTPGETPVQIEFSDTFETLPNSLTSESLLGSNSWRVLIGFAPEGQLVTFAPNLSTESDTVDITPAFQVPAGGYFHFQHAYEVETIFDGGVVEYSIDNGLNWTDMSTLPTAGKQYDSTLSSDNPMGAREAYTGVSHGYVSTRYDLSSLSGEEMMVRFRFATDTSIGGFAWFVDNVLVYRCFATTPPSASAGANQAVAANSQVTLDASASSDVEGTVTFNWVQNRGFPVTLSDPTAAQPTFTAPPVSSNLRFQLTVTDEDGAIDRDYVAVTATNTDPIANAGDDLNSPSSSMVTLDASGSSDAESPISYNWTQISGPNVSLSTDGSPTAQFTAPDNSANLVFSLTVTDSGGLSDTDEIAVVVTNTPPNANAGADQSVRGKSTVTLNGTGSNDLETSITYSWIQTSGPGVSLTGATTASPTFGAPNSDTTLTFDLTVTDVANETSTDSVTINIKKKKKGGTGPVFIGLLLMLAGMRFYKTRVATKH